MKILKVNRIKYLFFIGFVMVIHGCKLGNVASSQSGSKLPIAFIENGKLDSVSAASISWRSFFNDPQLIALIDTALLYNQELKIVLQEIEISKNEVRAKKGEYLPFLSLGAGSGVEKTPKYTRMGVLESELKVPENQKFPEPMRDFQVGVQAKWELDIWQKLRNDKRAANLRYLGSIEGKNFMQTQLISEIAETYYELLAQDNLNDLLQNNIEVQTNVLHIARQQMASAKLNQLAVNRFEAQLLNTQNLQFEVAQRIIEMENRLRFLCGNYSQSITRNSAAFLSLSIASLEMGLPSMLLLNRPDVKQAEHYLQASKLDVKSARANFYPRVSLVSGIGFQSFNPSFLVQPESALLHAAGDLVAPLVNRNGIKAAYYSANARQIQAAVLYQQSILNAFVEVQNQYWKSVNYAKGFETKNKEVDLLLKSVGIAKNLFQSARADYGEVLFTQREALAAKMELIELKKNQLQAQINLYKSLGGGWR